MFFKIGAVKFGFALFFTLFSISASAQTFLLKDNQWELLSLPRDASGPTVAELFQSALPASEYVSDTNAGTWRVWKYDSVIRDYVDPGLNGTLAPGEAFWILQRTGDAVLLDISTLPETTSSVTDECSNLSGCFELPVPTTAGTFTWAMLGNPLSWSVPFDDIRLKTQTTANACVDGCSLQEASGEPLQFTVDTIWIYDTSSPIPDYREVGSGDFLPTWRGFWFVARAPLNNTTPILLLPDTSQTGTISTRVTSPGGDPIEGVTVQEAGGGLASITDELGLVSFTVATNEELVLQFLSEGHANQVLVAKTPINGGEITLDVTMLAHEYETSFDAAIGLRDLVGPDGSGVSISRNALVDGDGQIVTGIVDISMTSVDVSNSAELGAFPGEFSGTENGQPETTLVSQGTVEYSLSQNGEPLQLAPSAFADITIPIHSSNYPGGTPISIGDTIPMWSLDEESGIWEQEGTGQVVFSNITATGLALQGSVSHFSWWNCDVAPETGTVRVGLFGPGTGTAIIKGSTSADIGFRPSSVSTTSEVGAFTDALSLPANEEICLWADVTFDNGIFATTPEVCVTVSANEDREILLLVEEAEFDLIARTDTLASGTTSVDGNVFAYLDRINVYPTSFEGLVTYEVDGDLPPGLSINLVNNNVIELSGLPTTSGFYSFSITGTNSALAQAIITFNYSISASPVPPALITNTGRILVYGGSPIFSINTFYMQGYNGGGYATSWTLTNNDATDLPPEMAFNEDSGVLTLSGWSSGDTFVGTITATNELGSDSETLQVNELQASF